MPKYVLTGVSGHLGSVSASHALEIATPEDELVFTSHSLGSIPAQTLTHWKSKGAQVQCANYEDIESLKKVFRGAEAVTVISTWLIGEGRRNQAKNVIDAAKASGVKRICYTSFCGAGIQAEKEDDVPFLPRDHRYTEGLIFASGLQYNIQRNYLYFDNVPLFFAPSWKFCGDRWLNNSAGVGGAYVSRDDCGRVLGALALGKGKRNTIYNITGPEPITDRDIFDYMCGETGYKAEFVDMTDEELKKYWLDRGLPMDVYGDFSKLPMKLCIGDLLCTGEMVARGHMAETSSAVEELTGRKPTAFREALAGQKEFFQGPNEVSRRLLRSRNPHALTDQSVLFVLTEYQNFDLIEPSIEPDNQISNQIQCIE